MTLKAPFPYFGAKSRVADVIWRAFDPSINNYVEPFCGSVAVLLGRPGGPGKIETVNDASCAIANFWRAVSAAPDEVAAWCDRPVNEADIHAIHVWLIQRLKEVEPQLRTDVDFFDARVAGYWVYGQCAWIGAGWCDELKQQRGQRQRPHMSGNHPGMGVHQKRPMMAGDNAGIGVHALSQQLPKLSVTDGASGRGGVHLPALGNDRGLNGVAAPPCVDWFRALQARLRRVRVACGDWQRVLGPSVLGKGKNVGGRRPCAVFLDPPYSHEFRGQHLYGHDEASVAAKARDWALEHGDDPDIRIALCGYEGEHEMPPNWTVHAWKGARGYASEDNDNRSLERIWFSPHCLPIDRQADLFANVGAGNAR